ncbi:MAG TPA: SDR family oxidoreductase, partial [Ktedonobacteraceae bacterium]|nr:SDR family oxidoreductase [Ktedonobacteraceae bacterium]
QAFHSAQLAFLKPALTALASSLQRSAPAWPYLSNVTGNWVTAEEATNPAYWGEHMCQTVQFSRAIRQIAERYPTALFVEVGAGQALRSFVLQHPGLATAERCLTLQPAGTTRQFSAREALWNIPAQLWQLGAAMSWPASASSAPRRLLCLPPYPFERQQHWVQPPATAARGQDASEAGKRAGQTDWFYAPAWEELPPEASPRSLQGYGPWLIFAGAAGPDHALVAHLRQRGETAYSVTPAASWRQFDEASYGLRPQQPEDYQRLWQTLRARGELPRTIIHHWGVEQAPEDPQAFEESLQRSFYSLLALVQAMIAQESTRETQIILLSDVRARQAPEALNALAQAAGLVISQEYPALICRSLEVVFAENESWTQPAVIERVLSACTGTAASCQLRADGSSRRTQVYRPVRLAERTEQASRLRREGVYLITGGLGNLGLALATHLGQTLQARLALTTRSPFPAREAWASWLATHDEQEKVARQIRQMQLIEQAGGQVLIIQADVADEAALRAGLAEIQTRWGTLHGVIHAAGFTNSEAFALLAQTDQALCQLHFRAKVQGVRTLSRVLSAHRLDFCLLCSSISAQLGGLGLLAYAAANRYLDAFAHQQQAAGGATPWLSVNWDTWQLDGETPAVGSSVAVYSMSGEEALRVFEQVLAQPALPDRLLISTGSFAARLRQWVKNEPFVPALQAAEQTERPRPALPGQRADYLRIISGIWSAALGLSEVGLNDNFFDLGGNSLIGLEVMQKLKKAFQVQLPAVALFEAPTIQALLDYLLPEEKVQREHGLEQTLEQRRARAGQNAGGETRDIALVAMSGRFPGADSVEAFWDNLRAGVESIRHFSREELLAAGTAPELLDRPGFVAARPVLNDVAHFDAAFFGYSPREAAFTDPQHRLFLEVCWEALERAGYDPQRFPGLIGVFAGANISTYLLGMLGHPAYMPDDDYQMVIGNDKDALTTTVSYKLNLKGPSFAVQTFCSTSLVAVHLACQSLRQGECDLALAGGVSVRVPTVAGYVHQEGGMESADGHCRAFDAQASGTLFGDGAGVVVLKRLSDALADGDQIIAVIKGSAINNDGALKVSYSAPSVAGQAQVVEQALRNAGVSAESISYVEAHGTGTELGDPIEMAALSKAFSQWTEQQGYCALGSVKTNIGHLDRAAGISGLIKTALALHHREIPPSLHFTRANPEIDFAHSPFYVNTRLTPWERREGVRRAGLNSLGMGGTNVHVVLEEAPARPASGESRTPQVLLWSARTQRALEAQTEQLVRYLETHPEVPLADIAYTLQVGRRRFAQRRMLVCQSREEALDGLRQRAWKEREEAQQQRGVAWLIAGMGEQFPGMAGELYAREPRYRAALDEGLALLKKLAPELAAQVSTALLTLAVETPVAVGAGGQQLKRQGSIAEQEQMPPTVAHPAMFLSAYAHAQLLLAWGLRPQAMLGYSLGEYVAACLAGVFALEDALQLVIGRARLLETLEPGEMLAVMLSEEQIQPYLGPLVSLGAVTAPYTSVLSGSRAGIAEARARLSADGVAFQRVNTTHALHSVHMERIRADLEELVSRVRLRPPHIPYLSNVTGDWISAAEACDPAYWGRHLCQTVRMVDAIGNLLAGDELALLEVGRGLGLGSFVRQHPACPPTRFAQIVALLPVQAQKKSDQQTLIEALGTLWLAGCAIDWEGFAGEEQRQRV